MRYEGKARTSRGFRLVLAYALQVLQHRRPKGDGFYFPMQKS